MANQTGVETLDRFAVSRLLLERARELGDKPYFVFGRDAYSYRDTGRWALCVAAALNGLGIGVGSRVCVVSENCPQLVFAWLGISLAGAVAIPLNPALRGRFLRDILQTSDVDLVFVHARELPHVIDVIAEFPRIKAVVSLAGASDVTALGRPGGPPVDPFEKFTDIAPAEPDVSGHGGHTPFQILFSSGTTGRAKGVTMPHAHIGALAHTWIEATGLVESDTVFMPVQIFHGNGNYCMVAGLVTGSTIVVADKFHSSTYWESCRTAGATVAMCSISLYNIFNRMPPGPNDRAHAVRAFWQTPSDKSFETRFGVGSACGYGTTETGLVVVGRHDDDGRPEGSCGRINSRFYDVELVDAYDRPVGVDELGEFVVRPRVPFAMMTGYHANPEASAQVWRNLWHHTGDQGRRDGNGYYYFRTRLRDIIRCKGEQIPASQVEAVLLSHPEVQECAAMAYPSEISEDDVRVVMVPKSGAKVTLEQLARYCEREMPRYMIPRYYEFRDALPRTFHNRIEKYRLIVEGLGPGVWRRN